MNLSTLIHQFFDQYLLRIKGSSQKTIRTYRDTYTLLLPFAAKYHGVKIKSLKIGHLSNDLILTFLDYLEKERGNKTITRNQRLAAIKAMAKMIRFMHPQKSALANRILGIPQKLRDIQSRFPLCQPNRFECRINLARAGETGRPRGIYARVSTRRHGQRRYLTTTGKTDAG